MTDKKTKLLLLSLLFMLGCMNVSGQDTDSLKELPWLTGRVTNADSVPIPNAKITIESFEGIVKFTTDENGEYDVGVEPGIYVVRLDEWSGKLIYKDYKDRKSYISSEDTCESFFRPFKRANIKLSPSEKVTLNFVLSESGCVNWAGKRTLGVFSLFDHGSLFPNILYETLITEVPGNGFLNLIVEFSKREEKNNEIIYSAYPTMQVAHPRVVMTYDHLTIYADRIIFNTKKKTIKTEGKVMVEDGKNKYPLKSVSVSIKNDIPAFVFEK